MTQSVAVFVRCGTLDASRLYIAFILQFFFFGTAVSDMRVQTFSAQEWMEKKSLVKNLGENNVDAKSGELGDRS